MGHLRVLQRESRSGSESRRLGVTATVTGIIMIASGSSVHWQGTEPPIRIPIPIPDLPGIGGPFPIPIPDSDSSLPESGIQLSYQPEYH